MKFRAQLDSVLEKTLVVIMSAMVINVLWQVFSRYILTNPSSFTDELARYLMIWVGVLGAAYVAGKGNHVAITYFSEKMSPANLKKNPSFHQSDHTGFCRIGHAYRRGEVGLYHFGVGTTFSSIKNPSWGGLLCNTHQWNTDYFL